MGRERGLPRNLYITSAEGTSGKSIIALGLLDALAAGQRRVGVFRPLARSREADHVLDLLRARLDAAGPAAACIGATYDEVHADPDGALERIITRYRAIAPRYDVLLILGSDYTDVSTPTELGYNARIAVNLGAPVLLVLGGRNQGEVHEPVLTGSPRTAREIAGAAEVAIAELLAEHAQLLAVVANRVAPDALDAAEEAIRRALGEAATIPVGAIPEDPVLVAPTIAAVMDAVDGSLYRGDPGLLDREVMDVVVAAMSVDNALGYLADGAAVVVPGDRSDVLLALLLAHEGDAFPSPSAIVMNGGLDPSPAVARLIAGSDVTLPVIRTRLATFETVFRITRIRSRLAADSPRKLERALALFEEHVDAGALITLTDGIPHDIVTPLAFEHALMERARSNRKRIVLPEGNDDRILRAASILLAREAAEITILGDQAAIEARAGELGLDLATVSIVSPRDADLLERFAGAYAELRAHKGMTIERAREIVSDVSPFGTLMVQLAMVDGMVSGATHTTAETIRPAFEVIRTQPEVGIVSSVFLMCLADRVLVYGDCAINPNPSAEQLADIAISSAATAQRFGIEPRVAMLSYSTGESGTGDDVERVRAATTLVRERQPGLPVDGPMQYDAAADPGVAATKMPGSPVAGRATVFIFPDLNTGNNTYKAVQRSAGAVAIGPVLQGLRKPVNDLSRGATVRDIVNTVAITVIQAQDPA